MRSNESETASTITASWVGSSTSVRERGGVIPLVAELAVACIDPCRGSNLGAGVCGKHARSLRIS